MVSNWELSCKTCGHSFTFGEIEDTLENYFLPLRPSFPREGLLRECPSCLETPRYAPFELSYKPSENPSNEYC